MRRIQGFSLIELMIAVAIVGILAAIGVPSYTDYVTRSKIAEATSTLSDVRVRMEQYFLDNRRYATVAGGATCGANIANTRYFTIACVAGINNTYTVTATGGVGAEQSMAGFTYSITETNVRATTAVPANWTANANCWVIKKGGFC